MAEWEDVPVTTPVKETVKQDTWEDVPTEEPKAELTFPQQAMRSLSVTANTLIDAADIVASTPAWIGGMGAGILAAGYKGQEEQIQGALGMEKTPGGRFGAAQAVKEGVLETFGNPIRRALTGAGVLERGKEGQDTSIVATGMGKIGEGLHAIEKGVTEKTGEDDLGKGASFFTELFGPAIIHKSAKGIYVSGKKVKDAVVKTKEVKEIDPEFEQTRIQPEESISDVIQRAHEREALAKKLDEGESTMGELPLKVEGETPVVTNKTRDTALAHTDKDGKITLNDTKIEADFKDGFPYIFDATTETGKQKAAVFEQIKVSKEEFAKAIPDVATYKEFLLAHEESHVKNGDRAVYPRTSEGKVDLLHPDAIKIEGRATLDALKAINKESPSDAVIANVYEFITKEKLEHGATIEGASMVIEKALNSIIADHRLVDIRVKGILDTIPDPKVRERLTRAGELEKSRDALMTDVAKQELLTGTGKPREGSKYVDGGLEGALEGMNSNINRGKFPKDVTREDYIKKRDNLSKAIEDLKNRASENKAIEVLKDIQDYLKEVGDNAVKVGLVDALRNNYIPHVLDFSKSKLTPKEQADFFAKIAKEPRESKLVRNFAEQRHIEFLRELEARLKGTGVVVHTDIAKIVDAYGKSMQTSIIQKSMIDYFKAQKGPDGNPWMMPDGPLAKELGYVSFEGVGTRAIKDLRVHPQLADSMGFMFRERDPNLILRALGGVTHLTKAINVVGSLFHMKSLMEAGFLADPKLFAKELMTAGAGTRAALRAFKERGNPLIDLLIREGGLMIKVEDVSRTIVADSGVFLDGLATKAATKTGLLKESKDLKLTQHITDAVDKKVLQHLNEWTWDYAHTGQKLNVAMHKFQQIKLKNPEMSDAVIAKEVSSFVNNTFGGINWLQVANQVNSKALRGLSLKMAGITGRDYAQLTLFAPDWTVSTLRAVTTALPKQLRKPQTWEIKAGIRGLSNPKTQGDLARRYVINTAITYLTILNGINLAMSGQNIWENKDPTRLMQEDGTSIQAAKHSMEAVHWLTAPDKTLGNKLAFGPKALFLSTTGTAYPSPDAPKLKDTSALGRAKGVAMLAAPFAVGSAINAPEGEGLYRAGMSSLGLPPYGVSKEQQKKAIAKGRLEAKQKKLEEKRNK